MRLSLAALALILAGTYFLSGLYTKTLDASPKVNKAIKKIERLNEEPDREPSSALLSKSKVEEKPSAQKSDPVASARFELADLRQCYENESCPFSKADPKAYEYEIGQKIKAKLDQLTKWVRAQRIEHADISNLAREYLESADGHVKKAALDLIATQPPSPENFQSVLNNALNTNDSNLTGQSLMELQKYSGDTETLQINQILTEIMSTGSFVVKNRVAELISTHLNQRNVDYFDSYSRTLPMDNPVRTFLSAAITEYRRAKSGG